MNWWQYPCEYGHFDCSYKERGPCGDEHNPPEEEERPTNTWKCVCGATIERYRGDGDLQCGECGTWYNSFGQRLRDDWMDNPSNWSEEVGDLEGYEIASLRRERGR